MIEVLFFWVGATVVSVVVVGVGMVAFGIGSLFLQDWWDAQK